jgi:probable phosphoglycerate mutase
MRHCQTFGNAKGVTMGQKEFAWSLLSAKGVQQALSIGYRIAYNKKEDFSVYKFFSSPTARTQQTLKIVTDVLGLYAAEIETDSALLSKNKGIFEGLAKDEVKELYSDELQKKELDKWSYRPPEGGESLEDMYQRLLDFYERHKNEPNLMLSLHQTGVVVLINILLKKSHEEIKNIQDFSHNQNYFYSWDGKEIQRL